MIRFVTAGAGILGVAFFISTTILAGSQLPEYSHVSQFISESYATGTPYGTQLRYFGFIPSGILIAIFSFLMLKIVPKSILATFGLLGLGVFYGLATIVVSIFPCDEGCNKELVNPSLSQFIHNLTGVLTYLVVPISLIMLGVAARNWKNGNRVALTGIGSGLICLLFVGILSSDPQSNFAGLFQRIIEGCVLFFIVNCSFYLITLQKE